VVNPFLPRHPVTNVSNEEIGQLLKAHVASGTSPNAIIMSGLTKIGSIVPNAAKVSDNFDDHDIWCDELSYPPR
jgi:methanogenic corrinoid protein MtbC1